MSAFHIRDEAQPEDADFILEAFDSALPHLASIGSEKQWGLKPRSTQKVFVDRIRAAVGKARSGNSDSDAVFIAEVPVDDDRYVGAASVRRIGGNQRMLKIGGAIVQGFFPSYVLEQPNLEAYVREAVERADSIYLSVMVSDFRVGALRKGAGALLAKRVRQYALENGKAAVYVDCWAGNGEGLVGYVSNVQISSSHVSCLAGSTHRWVLCQWTIFMRKRMTVPYGMVNCCEWTLTRTSATTGGMLVKNSSLQVMVKLMIL
ncbi:hypothetical protein J1614_010261 [Plenodomus biglobosus]|nr:hypothetical protein J1614_010261 [Plenodomus biglobosus]